VKEWGTERMRKYTTIDDRLYAYLLAHQPPEHDQLRALRARTDVLPDALVAARQVLEIGTFTGCSALAMALALPPGGRLTARDVNAASTSIARHYWKQFGVADRIDLRLASAIDTLAHLEKAAGKGQFDLAFIDADKASYDAYYEAALG
jgi:O-methyltransferase